MVRINIDSKEVEANRESTLLELARKNGIEIPTLCHHQAVTPYGACRLCLVEIKKEDETKLVASCTYPVREDGITVLTQSPKVNRVRKMILEFLLARCPEVEIIQEMSAEMGIKQSRFILYDNDDCILCGLCARVCEEIIGKSAVSFTDRGPDRKVSTPFNEPSEECVGCTACAFVCPTGAIKVEEWDEIRFIEKWNTEIPLQKCAKCDILYTPANTPGYILSKMQLPENLLRLCEKCRRKSVAESLSNYDVTSKNVIIKK